VLEIERFDLDEIAFALSDQTSTTSIGI